jgi:hypothetical protein
MDLQGLFRLLKQCRHAFVGAPGCVRLDSASLGTAKELLHGLAQVAAQALTQQLYARHSSCMQHKLCHTLVVRVADLRVVCVLCRCQLSKRLPSRRACRCVHAGPAQEKGAQEHAPGSWDGTSCSQQQLCSCQRTAASSARVVCVWGYWRIAAARLRRRQ